MKSDTDNFPVLQEEVKQLQLSYWVFCIS